MLFKKKIKCPYCNNVLDRKPSRKKKCPFCGKYIYVRNKKLVTEERANIIDELKRFNFTDNQYKESKKILERKFGHKPNYYDVIWHICNKEIIKNRNNYNELRFLYYNMALFLNNRNKDCFQILQQAKKMDLLYFKSINNEEVVINGGICPSCQKLNGKIFKIDDALKQMPIPNKNCTNIRHDKKRSFCLCYYDPTSEIIREIRKKYE
jgi:hypothetical protein